MIRELGQPGDLGWVIGAHGEMYARECGWGPGFEAMVARIVADFAAGRDPAREAAWIAERDGRRVGSVFCVDAREDDTAVLRVLLVDPAARGTGLGGRLVDTCVGFARRAGYRRMRLWTTANLEAARHLYTGRGFRVVGEAFHEPLGVTGQTYELSLAG